MTESERRTIIDLFESGMPLVRIKRMMAMTAAEFDNAIAEIKASGGFPRKKLGRDKVAEAFARGERDIYKIADELGLTWKTVKRYKVHLGIKTGQRPKLNYRHCERTNAINDDLLDGVLSIAEIARKHKVSWQYVKKLQNKLIEDENL